MSDLDDFRQAYEMGSDVDSIQIAIEETFLAGSQSVREKEKEFANRN